jgi:hypothetical protein
MIPSEIKRSFSYLIKSFFPLIVFFDNQVNNNIKRKDKEIVKGVSKKSFDSFNSE